MSLGTHTNTNTNTHTEQVTPGFPHQFAHIDTFVVPWTILGVVPSFTIHEHIFCEWSIFTLLLLLAEIIPEGEGRGEP
jgi:hypothetical protein